MNPRVRALVRSHIRWLVRATAAEGLRGTGRKEGREGVRAVRDAGGGVMGRAMAGEEEEEEEGRQQGCVGGGSEVCTRLSAPGVPCGPGSGVREG